MDQHLPWRVLPHRFETKSAGLLAGVPAQYRRVKVETFGGRFELDILTGYPPTVNSPEATEVMVSVVKDLLGETQVAEAPKIMGAEDFSFMAQAAPGCFLRLGVHNPGWESRAFVHTPTFRMDEDALPIGSASLVAAALGRPDGVNVNAILPGMTETERVEQLFKQRAEAAGTTPDQIRAQTVKKDGLKRLGLPEDSAELALFLCSERARHIQGTAIAVDGGSTSGVF